MKKTYNTAKFRRNLIGWMFMLPMIVILYIFIWRPTAMAFIWSFFDMRGYSVKEFCGLDNYIKVLNHSKFLLLLKNTVMYVVWSIIIGYLLPLVVAIMINEVAHFKAGFRVLIYTPALIPGIVGMLMWKFIYEPDHTGILNMVLMKLGFEQYAWLSDPKFTIIGIVIYTAWKGFPITMLLYYSALQGISVELYDAALIDGASPWQRMWNITRPGLEGLMLLNLVNQIINVFQIMEQPLAMTGGGPNWASATLSYQLYQYGFNSGGKGTGQAMALGVIIFLILIVFTVFYFWLNEKVENRY